MATEKEKLEKKLSDKIKQEEVAYNYLETVREERQELEQKIKSLSAVHVSEHALIRYFERIYKVPVLDIRKELNKVLIDLPLWVKQSRHITYVHNGLNLVIKNGTVVTILDPPEEVADAETP
jgi:ribosome-binding protein aMBF1 (putative translation factor)